MAWAANSPAPAATAADGGSAGREARSDRPALSPCPIRHGKGASSGAGAGAGFTSAAKAAPEAQRRAAARAIRETAGCALNIVFSLSRLNLMRYRIGMPMPLL